MQRDQRLRRRQDFAAAYRKGRVQSGTLLVVRVLPGAGSTARWGFVAGRVIGNAVARNRVKRRLREAARTLAVRPGVDIVVGARKPAAEADFQSLRRALRDLLQRAGVLQQAGADAGGVIE